jgi:SP family general alpha glucoside:H+ symporter-like MFS transporter
MAQVMAFNYSMAIQSTNIVSTGIAIFLMGKVGRRTFYLFGTAAIGVCMLIIGIVGFVPNIATAPRSIIIAVMMIFINLSFKLSLGPACYTIVGDVPNTRVRSQTIVLARTTYVIGGVVVQQIIPRQLSTTAWNWGGKSGLFWCGIDILLFTYTFFRIPETRNRSFLELDYLFGNKVKTRKFSTTVISREFSLPKGVWSLEADEVVLGEELSYKENETVIMPSTLDVDEKAFEERLEIAPANDGRLQR